MNGSTDHRCVIVDLAGKEWEIDARDVAHVIKRPVQSVVNPHLFPRTCEVESQRGLTVATVEAAEDLHTRLVALGSKAGLVDLSGKVLGPALQCPENPTDDELAAYRTDLTELFAKWGTEEWDAVEARKMADHVTAMLLPLKSLGVKLVSVLRVRAADKHGPLDLDNHLPVYANLEGPPEILRKLGASNGQLFIGSMCRKQPQGAPS